MGMADDFDPSLPARQGCSMQLVVFRQKLKEISGFSTVGLSTLSGVSPKNAALEDLIGSIAELPDTAEQVTAVEDILVESNTLWSDQHVHVIARVIQDMVTPGKMRLRPDAYPPIGEKLVEAALAVAPELLSELVVNDSLAHDVLRCSTSLLVQRPEFRFPPTAKARLEAAGLGATSFTEQPKDDAGRGVRHKANVLRKQITTRIDRQIEPDELASWVGGTATLPPDLRGRLLALLANVFWNTMRNPKNNSLNDDICNMIDELPPTFRITPLEAFYNQLNLLAHEFARSLFPIVLESVNRLPESGEPRFDRSRKDLLDSLRTLGEAFRTADFRRGESLSDYRERIAKQTMRSSN